MLIRNTFYIKIILLFFSVISLFLLILTSFNSFYWMDDFWFRAELLNDGLINVQWDTYWNWDGRAISPLYLGRNILVWILDYSFSWLASLVSMAFLTFTAYFLLRILTFNNWETITNRQIFIFTLLIMFVLVMIFRPHLSRTLYWVTGSFYNYANFFSVFLVYRYFKTPNSWFNLLWIFIAISAGPNNGIMLLAFLSFGKFFKILEIKTENFWVYFSFGLLTLILVIIAPGNFVRANGQLDFSISSMISGGIAILKEYSGMSLWLLPGSIVIALILHPFLSRTSPYLPVLIIICGACSILPFLPMPNAASKHTAIFFQTFLLIAGVQVWTIVLDYLGYYRFYGFANIILILFVLFFGWQISDQLVIGQAIKVQMNHRFEVLEANRGSEKELILDPIPLTEDNWTNRFSDIDPNFESNIYFEKYFQIYRVKISDSK